jgi:hypothetical protein
MKRSRSGIWDYSVVSVKFISSLRSTAAKAKGEPDSRKYKHAGFRLPWEYSSSVRLILDDESWSEERGWRPQA